VQNPEMATSKGAVYWPNSNVELGTATMVSAPAHPAIPSRAEW